MKLRDKIKSYSFWVSIASAVILILKVLGNRFGFTVDESMISDLFTALCSILVLLGIIVVPSYPTNNLNKSNEVMDFNNPIQNEAKQVNVINDSLPSSQETSYASESNNFEIKTEVNPKPVEHNSTLNEENNSLEDTSFTNQDTDNKTEVAVESRVEKIENNLDGEALVNQNNSPEQLSEQLNDVSVNNLKELFNLERVKFAKNMNEYIFELQEEIRKAREQM